MGLMVLNYFMNLKMLISIAFTITNSDEILEELDPGSKEIENGVAVWLSEGSGWTIEEILGHYVNVVKHLPLGGSSVFTLTRRAT